MEKTLELPSLVTWQKRFFIEPRHSILLAARRLFFERGYSVIHMDDLAAELAMSKRTLYELFDSKEEVLQGVMEITLRGILTRNQQILSDPALGFLQRLEQLMGHIAEKFAAIQPHVWLDIKRHAPRVYERLDLIRGRVIPATIGRLVEEGQREGVIRPDIHPRLVGEVQLAAVRHLIQPEIFAALGLVPASLPPQIFRLLFWGLLTDEGRRPESRAVPAAMASA